MELWSTVQINTILSILLMIILIHAFLNMNRKKMTNKLFIWLVALICFVLVFEILDTILNNSNQVQFIFVHWIVNAVGFIITPCILLIGYVFMKGWINQFKLKKDKINKLLLIPILINAILTLMSFDKNGVFYITNENIYKRGELFFIIPCISALYFAYSLYFIFKNRKKFLMSEQVIFTMFYIVLAICTGIKLYNELYLSIWNGAAFVIVIMYILILNSQSYRDSLTGLGNRLYYERYTQNLKRKKLKQLFLIFIDIDQFKLINDQCGHTQGDDAIKNFANLLIESFTLRKNKIMRIGGDEFLILIHEKDQEKVESYIQNLTNQLEAFNRREGKPYNLTFSYGLTHYGDKLESISLLLEDADHLMYEQKQRRRDESSRKAGIDFCLSK